MTITPQAPAGTEPAAESLTDGIVDYIRHVRAALTGAGIELDSSTNYAYGPHRVRIPTGRYHGDFRDPHRWRCVLVWDETHGWSAGSMENVIDAPIEGHSWFDLGLVPSPDRVTEATVRWLADPSGFSTKPPRLVDERPLAELLAPYTQSLPAASAAPAKPDPDLEHQALHERMLSSGLSPAGHYRAAELLLGTYGDEFSRTDLAAAQVHATLSASSNAVARDAARIRSLEEQLRQRNADLNARTEENVAMRQELARKDRHVAELNRNLDLSRSAYRDVTRELAEAQRALQAGQAATGDTQTTGEQGDAAPAADVSEAEERLAHMRILTESWRQQGGYCGHDARQRGQWDAFHQAAEEASRVLTGDRAQPLAVEMANALIAHRFPEGSDPGQFTVAHDEMRAVVRALTFTR